MTAPRPTPAEPQWQRICSWWWELRDAKGKRLADVCNFDGRWTVPWSGVFWDSAEAAKAFVEQAVTKRRARKLRRGMGR